MNKIILLFCCCLWSAGLMLAGDKQPITLLDLRYTLQADLTKQADVDKTWDHLHAIATLQGIVNRDYPQLYIKYVEESGVCIDQYWWDKYRTSGQWLANRDTVLLSGIVETICWYKDKINGVVVYDPNVPSTSNVASAIAGVENLMAIRYDRSPGSLYTQVVLQGPKLKEKIRLLNKDDSSLFTGKGTIPETLLPSSGSIKNDPYLWFIEKYLKAGKCNTEYAAYYIDQYWRKKPQASVPNHHTLSNHDFFVSKKAFFFDLSPWSDEPATDDLQQPVGTDYNTLTTFLKLAYEQNKGDKFCYIGGFPSWAFKYTGHAQGTHDDVPTEWEFSKIISAYNAFKDADAIGYGALANASFWQHFPLKPTYKQHWVTKEALRERGYLNEQGEVNIEGRNFIIFYVGDYDASSWITQRTPTIWDDPNRGKLPLMWCISPVLQQRVPMVLHNFRATATENDYFAAADNGAGYLMPGMLQEPRPLSGLKSGLDAWATHCKPYYKQWDLSITGFVIDGFAPGLTKEGLDCYASFSPNGIVPQKIPLTLLHGNMPVIRADYDINDGVISTLGLGGNERHEKVDMIDPHWYVKPDYFFANAHLFDTQKRDDYSVYVGEYAANQDVGSGNMLAALSEAAFLTGMERNSDLVTMTSYAPLLENSNDRVWPVNLICFDSHRVMGRSSYYVQKMFAENRPSYNLATKLLGQSDGTRRYTISGYDEATKEIIIKVVNAEPEPFSTVIELKNTSVLPEGKYITLAASSDKEENTLDNPLKIYPKEIEYNKLSSYFTSTFQPWSFTVLRIKTR